MKQIHILLTAVIIAFSVTSCSKIRQIKEMLSNADVVTHFGYHEKSYWVYRDALTESTDSFVIAGYNNKVNLHGIPNVADLDDISMTILAYNSKDRKTDTFNWRLALGVGSVSFYIDDPKAGDHSYSGKLFCYPFKKGFLETIISGGNVSYSKITNVYATYVVNGTTYYNVAEINLYAESSTPGYTYAKNDYIYISADAGVIKMNIDHPEVALKKEWEVLRYDLKF